MAEPGYEVLAPYEHEIHVFVGAMRYKLKKNAHKGKWEKLSLVDALRMLRNEVDELAEAIKHGNPVEVMLEAADVANFAMMVSNIAVVREDDRAISQASGTHKAVGNRPNGKTAVSR